MPIKALVSALVLVVSFWSTALLGAGRDSCLDCHGDLQQMAALGYPGFAVTAEEARAQTGMPARCDQCHLGDRGEKDRAAAHRGMAKLLVVSTKGLEVRTSARRFPLEYGTNPVNRIYAVTDKKGAKVKDPTVAALSWHDKKPESLTQSFDTMKKTCGRCHPREFAEFSKSTMGTNGKQSQYRGWLSERGPHNCGPWFAGNEKAIAASTRIAVSPQSSIVNQRVCNTCHVGCLDCHFNPQPKDPVRPAHGAHSFVKTPPAQSCYGNGRSYICHSGPEDRRRGAGYFGGSFSFPEGSEADVHLKARVGCLDCHPSSKSDPELGHATVKRQARPSCARCHGEAVRRHAASRHRNLSCEACHIQQVGGYQGTYWGPGKVAGTPTAYFKFKGYYGYLPQPILIWDQGGLWIPVKPFPMAVMNQISAPFRPGLHWRYPKGLPDRERTDDAWGYVGLFGGLPENDKALLWIQRDKMSHKLGKSRTCRSCHGPDGAQRQKVSWEYGDPGALPFKGGHEVVADRKGLAIVGMWSERIEPEPGYAVSSFAPWMYLKDAWRIDGDFALPVVRDDGMLRRYEADPVAAGKAGLIHGRD
jgi:hypothetical protein